MENRPENRNSILLDTTTLETRAAVAYVIKTAIFLHVAIDEKGRETTIAMNRRQIAVIVSEILEGGNSEGVPHATVTMTPRTRSPEEEWTTMGINKVDIKGRVLIPVKIRETCPPNYMYREMNPTKKSPAVIILSQKKIQPTNILLGPMPVNPDNLGRISLKDFDGAVPIIPPDTEAVFHKRGDLIIVLPENAPAPDQEFIDRFIQPIPSITPFAEGTSEGTSEGMSHDRPTVTALVALAHDQVKKEAAERSNKQTASRQIQQGRRNETWTTEGPNKIEEKGGRVFVPARLRKSLDTKELLMYTELNPNGQAPVVILSTTPISPSDKLLGPTSISIDNQGRILLVGFPGAENLKVPDGLTFHRRGNMIVILPGDEPNPTTEFIAEFVQA